MLEWSRRFCVTFAGLSLLQQLRNSSLCLLEPVLKGLVTDSFLTRSQVVNQSLQFVKLLPLLVHLEDKPTG